ncbi:hypothetical protein [Caldivirga maquilingensis]|uniref:Uncharacterized protein n=1 Tax=Caldivirga maquilingensis (strain ATCC 700844 / DSM 13496 / JCM 10307 / IC-167) TaxID=397948 RepID=A8ME88_CALMQ|nr:hypothetical protein [Caldivirga maquilingensis]ABW02094.1 conserved hypothetical protein [Caldivirga maquilingensis IC-167]
MPSNLSFLVGFMFGFGTWVLQTLIVLLVYKGVVHGVRDWSVMVRAGGLALGILGVFMISLGVFSMLYG